jgi:hypothetical protein
VTTPRSAGFDVPPTGEEILANIRDALDKVREASRVIIIHPDLEALARKAVDESPFPGLFSVTVTDACPTDRLYLVPKVQDTYINPPGVGPPP